MNATAGTSTAGWRATPAMVAGWWRSLSERQAMIAAGIVAAVWSFNGLARQPLSWDEAVSANAARRTLPALWTMLRHTDAPLGVYYLGLHGWTSALRAVGVTPTEGWLRLPSALAAVAAAVLTVHVARYWYGTRVAFMAGLLVGVQPLMVFYAQDARPYTWATLLVVASVALFMRARADPRPGRVAAYTVVATTVCYAHLLAVVALVPQVVVALRSGPHRRRFAFAYVLVVVMVAPLAWISHRQTAEIGWIPRPTVASVASFAARVGGGVMLVPLLAIAAVAASRWRAGGGPPGLLLGWALGPPIALCAAGFVQPDLVPRYALVAVPATAIVAAGVAARIPRRLGAALLACALAAGATTSAVQQAAPYKYENFQAGAEAVADTARPGDGLLFMPASQRVGYDVYAGGDRDDLANPRPVDVAESPSAGPLSSGIIGGQEIIGSRLARLIPDYGRIYLIGNSWTDDLSTALDPTDTAKIDVLRRDYVARSVDHFGQLTVTVFVRS